MDNIGDILSRDNINDLLFEISEDIENISSLVVIFTTHDGILKWRRTTSQIEALGMLDVVHHDMLIEDD